MSRYTVVWVKRVEDRLIELWVEAEDREAVRAATHQIDLALSSEPGGKGGLMAEGLRWFEDGPLRVLFDVREADRIVEVVAVRRTTPQHS